MIAIVDYQMGNLTSIWNMLRKIGARASITSDPDDVARADKVILPGVGTFDRGMHQIDALGLRPVLEEKVGREQIPLLGICLGMQLLARRSEEGDLPGLGWMEADVVRFRFDPQSTGLKIPHMGWNDVDVCQEGTLFEGMGEDVSFYFVHGYHVLCDSPADVLATTTHGYQFPASVRCGNVYGTQFHPEKSHRYGFQLLKNFVERC